MKLLRLTLITFLLCFNQAQPQSELKILTYNLMGMKPNTEWETRLQHTINQIIEHDPDIIGLQEINSLGGIHMGQIILDSLESHFGISYYMYDEVTHVSWSLYNESIGIISKYPVIGSNYHDLPSGVFPRKVVWNLISTPLGPINFFSTHLSYLDNHNNIRMAQVEEISEFVTQKENSYSNIGSVLMGDFNCSPGSDPIEILENQLSGIPYTLSYEYANPGLNGFSYEAGNLYKKIDYIFIKDNSFLAITQSDMVINNPYDGIHYPSDHLGILTTIINSDETLSSESLTSIFVPSQFKLGYPFPNPFNSTTKVEFYLSGQSFVKYSIIDSRGIQISSKSKQYSKGNGILSFS